MWTRFLHKEAGRVEEFSREAPSHCILTRSSHIKHPRCADGYVGGTDKECVDCRGAEQAPKWVGWAWFVGGGLLLAGWCFWFMKQQQKRFRKKELDGLYKKAAKDAERLEEISRLASEVLGTSIAVDCRRLPCTSIATR